MIAGMLLLAAQAATQKCQQNPSTTSPGASTSSASSTNNVLPIAVNAGPTNNALNQPFASVTLCVPGT